MSNPLPEPDRTETHGEQDWVIGPAGAKMTADHTYKIRWWGEAKMREFAAAEVAALTEERDRLREELAQRKIVDEMDSVAIQYAHKLALDLECVLSDYHGRWWDAAINTIGEYRSAMNAIHERESPTHMGEPLIVKRSER